MGALRLPEIRVIPYRVNSAEYNMAADEYCLSLQGPILRFFGWEKPTLSFGRSNPHLDELDLDFCRKSGIQAVRRISGGKTVLHHQEITYTFSADTAIFPSSIVEAYRLISQPLANGFRKYGLEPEMKRIGKTVSKSSICFNEISAYELTLDSRKVVGSAQYRQRKRFFQHGSILLDIDWELWKSIWKIPSESTVLENRITTVWEQMGSLPETLGMVEILTEEFAGFFQTCAVNLEFSQEDRNKISELQTKYVWKGF